MEPTTHKMKSQKAVPEPEAKTKPYLHIGKDQGPTPDTWVVDMRIRTREDITLHWNPVWVQVEVDRYNEARWRESLSEAVSEYILVRKFKWADKEVI